MIRPFLPSSYPRIHVRSEGDTVNVVRGLKTLKAASLERNDGHIDFLNTLTSINVHTDCRKVYCSKNCVEASKRRRDEGERSPSPLVPVKKRIKLFDFKNLCLFCGQPADRAAELKQKLTYRRTISNVSSEQFRDNVVRRAEERDDFFGNSVRNRVLLEHDLVAARAKYHTICYTNFLNRVPSADNQPREVRRVTEAMEEIFRFVENHKDSQFTLRELKNVLTNYVPDDKTILARLRTRYSTNVVITGKPGSSTIVSFRGDRLSETWRENEINTPEEERLRIVEAAAAIVREDIRASVVETEPCPPPSIASDDNDEEIPQTLSHLLREIVLKNRTGPTDRLESKCESISRAIMDSMRERSFSPQLLLKLSVWRK